MGRTWYSYWSGRQGLLMRARRLGNPLYDARLSALLMTPVRLWKNHRYLRLFGLQVSEKTGVVTVQLPGKLTLAIPLPSPDVADGHDEWCELPQLAHSLKIFMEVAYCDQYDICASLKPGDVVLDVGANIGSFTLLASRLVGPKGRVVAVEPAPDNVNCLRLMCERNGLHNVQIVPLAIGAECGEISLSIHPVSGGHSAKRRYGTKTVPVRMTSVDALMHELGLHRLDFVKADTEGMEEETLRGAEISISTYRPRLSVSAYHFPGDRVKLGDLIRSLSDGYRVDVFRANPEVEEVLIAHHTAL